MHPGELEFLYYEVVNALSLSKMSDDLMSEELTDSLWTLFCKNPMLHFMFLILPLSNTFWLVLNFSCPFQSFFCPLLVLH